MRPCTYKDACIHTNTINTHHHSLAVVGIVVSHVFYDVFNVAVLVFVIIAAVISITLAASACSKALATTATATHIVDSSIHSPRVREYKILSRS